MWIQNKMQGLEPTDEAGWNEEVHKSVLYFVSVPIQLEKVRREGEFGRIGGGWVGGG